MRRLAAELGAGAMSLYHHVPNKVELLDGMIDIVFGEIDLPATDVDWRTAMRQRARSTRAALNRHRWAVGLMESRLTDQKIKNSMIPTQQPVYAGHAHVVETFRGARHRLAGDRRLFCDG